VLEPGLDHTAQGHELACRELANQRHDAGSRDQRPVEVEGGEASERLTRLEMPLVAPTLALYHLAALLFARGAGFEPPTTGSKR
jgi:hypothetical protein